MYTNIVFCFTLIVRVMIARPVTISKENRTPTWSLLSTS